MKHPLQRAAVVALAGILFVLASGCSGSADKKAASGKVPDKVALTLRNDVDTFDPFLSQTESGAKQVFDAIYDTLVRIGTSNGKVVVNPSMATKWSVTPDSATFKLHDGLTCGDGTPLTASGIAESLKHLADPKTGAGSATRIFGPAGVKTIESDDTANTITIKLKAPYTLFLQNLAAGAYIVCPSALKDLKKLAGTPASTGPYNMTKLQRGESYVLERRDTPTVSKSDLPAEITMRVVANDTTRANLVSTKQVDISSLLGRDAERLKGNYEPVLGPAALASALLFNQAPGLPGANKDLRTALAQAVDPTAYAKAATFGLGKAIDTEYTPNMTCYDPANKGITPTYDLDAAKASLQAAGYGPGAKKLTLRVLGIDTQNSGPELVADSLRKLGVDVKFKDGNLAQAIDVVFGTGDWDVMVFPYEVVAPVPSGLVNQIRQAGGADLAEYNGLVEKAAATEGQPGCDLWSQAEASLLKDVDIKPLEWANAAWFTNGLTFRANYFNVDTRTIRTK